MTSINKESFTVLERDEHGQIREIKVSAGRATLQRSSNGRDASQDILNFMKKLFLPSGYPNSVTPDYLRYQILNALAAACNSLAGLIASRSVLEGQGVGDSSANPTYIMLTNVALDGISRVATIFGAHLLGSSLAPECKTYRFLADVLNDAALVSDALSSLLTRGMTVAVAWRVRFMLWTFSATCRALCGLAAGGSKAAISLHFASPLGGTGDLGDLSAKDSSKETTLALLGMLLGSLIVPYLTTPFLTYAGLLTFVGLHLILNYAGVRGLHLRTFNRQRVAMAWLMYRQNNKVIPTPVDLGHREHLFANPDYIRDPISKQILGRCSVGSSYLKVFPRAPPAGLYQVFQNEKFLVWYDEGSVPPMTHPLHVHIVLKEGCTPLDHLKGWLTASELARSLTHNQKTTSEHNDDATALLARAYSETCDIFPSFLSDMRLAGWNADDIAILPGAPKSLLVQLDTSPQEEHEDRKFR